MSIEGYQQVQVTPYASALDGGGCHSQLPVQGKVVARQTTASVSATSEKELSVVTAEGDNVSISVNQTVETEFSGYRLRGRIPGQRFSLQSMEASRSVSIEASVTVEGNLNAEELADIHKLIRTLGKVADQPHNLANLHRLEGLSNLDTISTASFQLDQSVEYDVSSYSATARDATGSSQGTLAQVDIPRAFLHGGHVDSDPPIRT